MNRSELPLLLSGIVLALAGVGLAAAHIAVPDYVTNGSVLLIGAAAGAVVPGRSAAALPPSSSSPPIDLTGGGVVRAATPEGQAAIHASNAASAAARAIDTAAELRDLLAKAQATRAPATPPPPVNVAPGQAEPVGGVS